jgi:hypothetical protein
MIKHIGVIYEGSQHDVLSPHATGRLVSEWKKLTGLGSASSFAEKSAGPMIPAALHLGSPGRSF